MSDERIEPKAPTSDEAWENKTAGDDAMEDDLTEERQITPAQREDVAETQVMDP